MELLRASVGDGVVSAAVEISETSVLKAFTCSAELMVLQECEQTYRHLQVEPTPI